MNLEDYPVYFEPGSPVRLLLVPELPEARKLGDRCEFCVAKRTDSRCGNLKRSTDFACHATGPHAGGGVFVREEEFYDYVVETVRRRVG
jgi:hypothetical protein